MNITVNSFIINYQSSQIELSAYDSFKVCGRKAAKFNKNIRNRNKKFNASLAARKYYSKYKYEYGINLQNL